MCVCVRESVWCAYVHGYMCINVYINIKVCINGHACVYVGL